MPARRVKTYYKELGHRMHRSHRSKKGRIERGSDYEFVQEIRRRKEEKFQRYLLKENIKKAYEYKNKVF